MDKVKFEVVRMHPKFTNSIVVSAGGECVIFDAWGLVVDWLKFLLDAKLNLRAIYCTHVHGDHISATPELAEKLNIPWYLNHRDLSFDGMDFVLYGNELLEYFKLPLIPADYKKPLDLRAGRREILPGLFADIIETPGHSSGGVTFHFPSHRVLIIGDTLFQDGIGRYDLHRGDFYTLRQSVSKIYNMNLPDDTMIIHGHGDNTTIGIQKHQNPYFKGFLI
jgi:glyoxylase-like metal-dependent hydrolase (beta-lactamase superfamily II)